LHYSDNSWSDWTESGSFVIGLGVDSYFSSGQTTLNNGETYYSFNENLYLYTNGKSWSDLSVTGAIGDWEKVPKLSITQPVTTIAFNQFVDASEIKWREQLP